jgi:hypothetical protein
MNAPSPTGTTPTSLLGILDASYDNHGVVMDVLQTAREIALAQHDRDLQTVLNAVDEDERSAAFERLLKATDALFSANQAMENVLASQRNLLRATDGLLRPGHDQAEVSAYGDKSAAHLAAAGGHIDTMAGHMDGPHTVETYERYVHGVGWNVKEAPLSGFIAGLRAVAELARQRARSLVERIRGIQAHMGSRVISRVAMGRQAIAALAASIGRKSRSSKDTAQERARGVLAAIHKAGAAVQQMADKAVETVASGVIQAYSAIEAVGDATQRMADKAVETVAGGVIQAYSAIEAVGGAAQRAAQTVGVHAAATVGVAGDLKDVIKGNYSNHVSRLRESLNAAPGAPTQAPAAPVEMPKVSRAEILEKVGFTLSVASEAKDGDIFPRVTWAMNDFFGQKKVSEETLDTDTAGSKAEAAAWHTLVGQAGFLKSVDVKQLSPEEQASLVSEAYNELLAMREAQAAGQTEAAAAADRERVRG